MLTLFFIICYKKIERGLCKMKFWKRIASAALAAAVAVGFSVSSASACTSLFVGSELTENGSTYFGRIEDYSEYYTKVFDVMEAADHAEGEMFEDAYGFSMPYPAHTYRYGYVRDSLEYGDNIVDDDGNVVIPAYAQAGINENGVSVTATVSTIYDNDFLDEFDAPTGNGICEVSIAGVILQSATSAREGVQILADILDEYGAGDDYGYYNFILIGDTKEVWNFQITSSHNYVAVRLPADKVSINPNIVTMGEVDTADTENIVASEGLISMPLENDFLVSSQYDADTYKDGDQITKINIRETYGTNDRAGQYTRYWQGVHYLNAELAEALDITTMDESGKLASAELGGPISYLFDADRKLSTYDVLRFFATRGEGTQYDSNEDSSITPVCRTSQAEVHLFEIRPDEAALPTQLATLEWLSVGRCEYSVFLPFYCALLTSTSDIYHSDVVIDSLSSLDDIPENAMYLTITALNDLCDNNREHYGVNVKAFWEDYQKALIEQQANVDKAMLNIYNSSPALAEGAATALGKAVAEEAFGYARQILTELWDFAQAYEAGELDEDEVFKPSVMGKLPTYSITMAFNDVDSGAWYASNVEYALENNLMLGSSATAFRPTVKTTGSHVAVILARLSGAGLVDTGANWDVEPLKWADEKGYSEGLEIGSNPITREDLIVMLWRYAGAETVEQQLDKFTDAGDISDYALDAMKWAVKTGLVAGYEDNTLRPAGNTSRAELAKLLNVLCDTILV